MFAQPTESVSPTPCTHVTVLVTCYGTVYGFAVQYINTTVLLLGGLSVPEFCTADRLENTVFKDTDEFSGEPAGVILSAGVLEHAHEYIP